MRAPPAIHTHRHPAWLLRKPQRLVWLHRLRHLALLRNWYVLPLWRQALRHLPPGSRILDAGCGDGDLLLTAARRHPQLHFCGIDRSEHNVALLQAATAALPNVQVRHADLAAADALLPSGWALVACVSVLQYLADDAGFLQRLRAAQPADGRLLLYVPVHGHPELPRLRSWLHKHLPGPGYDELNRRQHVHTAAQVLALLPAAGYRVLAAQSSFGLAGRLHHGMWAAALHAYAYGRAPVRSLAVLLAAMWLPLHLALMLADKALSRTRARRLHGGNGLCVLAEAC